MRLAILSGSVFGTADFLADEATERCIAAGFQVSRIKPPTVDALLAVKADAILLFCSTTGMGEMPEPIIPFYMQMQERFPLLTGIPFGVVGLGDSSYDAYCQAPEDLRDLLLELQAVELLPMLRVDASETVTPEAEAELWVDEFIELLQNR